MYYIYNALQYELSLNRIVCKLPIKADWWIFSSSLEIRYLIPFNMKILKTCETTISAVVSRESKENRIEAQSQIQ